MRAARILLALLCAGLLGFVALQLRELLAGSQGLRVQPLTPPIDAAASATQEILPGARPSPALLEVPDDPADNLYAENNAAVRALDQGELERAVEILERCHAARPEEETFTHNLAEALARLAQRDVEAEDVETREGALVSLQRASELAPERAELKQLLERYEKNLGAERGFWRKKTLHFEISFDGDRSELLGGTGPLENELEWAYQEIGELFNFFPVEAGHPRIRVVMLKRETFDAVTGLGDWAGGVFDGTVRVPVENLSSEEERLKRALRHELVHAFVHEAGGSSVPGWLNEGLAQWLEAPFLVDRPRDVDAARERLKDHALFPLERMRGTLASWQDVGEIGLAYAQSLAFVDYLRRMYGERLLFDLVRGCKQGRTPEDTFREIIGVDLALVQEDFAGDL